MFSAISTGERRISEPSTVVPLRINPEAVICYMHFPQDPGEGLFIYVQDWSDLVMVNVGVYIPYVDPMG